MSTKKPFFIGCAVGLVCGILIPILALLSIGTVFRSAVTPILANVQQEKLAVPPITSGLVADYDWELVGLDGALIEMESLRGRTIFLTFWRDTCVPCIAEIPALNGLHAQLGDEIAFVSVFVGKEGEGPVAVATEGVTFPVYTVPEDWPEIFDFHGTPATYIIAPDGSIVFKHVGGAKWDDPSAVAFILGLAGA